MSAADAIKAYETLAKEVFSEKKAKGKDGTFKASKLEEAIKTVVEKTLGRGRADARMYERGANESSNAERKALFMYDLGLPRDIQQYYVFDNNQFCVCCWGA